MNFHFFKREEIVNQLIDIDPVIIEHYLFGF